MIIMQNQTFAEYGRSIWDRDMRFEWGDREEKNKIIICDKIRPSINRFWVIPQYVFPKWDIWIFVYFVFFQNLYVFRKGVTLWVHSLLYEIFNFVKYVTRFRIFVCLFVLMYVIKRFWPTILVAIFVFGF